MKHFSKSETDESRTESQKALANNIEFESHSQIELALHDIREGALEWRVWYMLGMNEIKYRYRRSVVGPLWLTISMGVQGAVIGFLFSYLFQSPIDRYLPFLMISLVLWYFINSTIMDGTSTYTSASSFILQARRPLSVYVFQNFFRNIIIFVHTVVIFFVVAALYGMFPGWHYVLAALGFILFLINLLWASFFAAIIAVRFRDFQMIIQNAFTVLFWITPIVYAPEQLGGGLASSLVKLNPLYHIIEVVRAPMIESMPTLTNWIVTLVVALLGSLFTFLLFVRTRSRIPYWI
ncbi:MAG: ABC transporter permease [Paracoccaceae bacterium]